MTIVDSGPIVALINRHDPLHLWTVGQMHSLAGPLFTCERVITEVLFLIRTSERAIERLFDFIDKGAVIVDFALLPHFPQIRTLMRKYRDVPMSFADACVVRMAELHDLASIFTLDSDFRVYRKNGDMKLTLIAPN